MSDEQYIYKKYNYEYDEIGEVYDIKDYMNALYKRGGTELLMEEFFLPAATKEYIEDYMKLVKINT